MSPQQVQGSALVEAQGERPRGKAPGSSEDTSFYSTKNGPKIDAFLPGYYSRNYQNWQTKNISKITFIFCTNEGVRNP